MGGHLLTSAATDVGDYFGRRGFVTSFYAVRGISSAPVHASTLNPAPGLRTSRSKPADRDSLPTRASLLRRLRDTGDAESWRTFFDTYWRLIYNVSRKSGLADEDAQDVVQETIIAVARRMPGFDYRPEDGSFKQWLLLITRRRIQDQLRRHYRSLPRAELAGASLAQVLESVPAPESAPDERIDAAWKLAWREHLLAAALARVRLRAHPKHYQVFDYCVLQNRPPREVARLLGMNAPQVYLAKHRVSRALRRAALELESEWNGK